MQKFQKFDVDVFRNILTQIFMNHLWENPSCEPNTLVNIFFSIKRLLKKKRLEVPDFPAYINVLNIIFYNSSFQSTCSGASYVTSGRVLLSTIFKERPPWSGCQKQILE